ncbi:MAG: hypothetical protein IJP62_07920 [Treponema sp.]|nr:hypothetical protein [Treponema sp.]
MKQKMLVAFFIMTVTSLFSVACSNGIDTMVDNYNGGFTVAKTVIKAPSILDADFNASSMLDLRYSVSYDSTLCLSAPTDGIKYEWTATLVESAPGVNAEENVTLGSGQTLSIFIRTSGLSKWCVYRLKLTVTGEDLKTYTDTARLIVSTAY